MVAYNVYRQTQELNNRIDYYDLVIQEREDDYQKMLLETERQAANVNDPSEEVKEAEKRRHQVWSLHEGLFSVIVQDTYLSV